MKMTEYIVFRVGDEHYRIESTEIKEVSRTKEMKFNKVPKTPLYIKGIMNVRGDVIPVIHLAERFANTTINKTPDRLIIARIEHYYLGMLVDQIVGNLVVSDSAFLEMTTDISEKTAYLKGIIRTETLTFFVLSVEKLI